MKILIFSWRDPQNSKAGGAEVLTQNLAKHWIKQGHHVYWLASRFPQAKPLSIFKGIKILRPIKFSAYSLFSYLRFLYKTKKYYQKKLVNKFDLVLDQFHGLPLFTPFYVKEKVVFMSCEVADSIWHWEISFPFSFFGQALEKLTLKIFRNRPFLTISPSTKKELQKLGVKNVRTIIPGSNYNPVKKIPKKAFFPLLISLGRITPMKRLEETLQAFAIILLNQPRAKLVICGQGEKKYFAKLKKLTKILHINKQVIFTGFVSEAKKKKFLSAAWLIVSTSVKEGWGLNIIEAASFATPSVVYDVPGLTDSVKNYKTGLICSKNKPEVLANNILKLISDSQLRKILSLQSLKHSRNFSWSKASQKSLHYFQAVLE